MPEDDAYWLSPSLNRHPNTCRPAARPAPTPSPPTSSPAYHSALRLSRQHPGPVSSPSSMASRPFKSALNNGLLQRVNSCPSLIPRSGPRQDRASGPGLPRAHALRPDDLFTPEDRAYLRDRLPLYEPATARTAASHFARLPRVYAALAEGCRARAAALPADRRRERLRRRRMADLAERLAGRYLSFSLVLPPSYVGEAIVRLRRGDSRASRFWEKLLDEVERANSAWSIARAYIAVLVAQTTLAAWAFAALASAPARLAVLAVNAVACVWCVTVAFEMLHGRYTAVDADEQELHDLLGGRSPWRHQPPSG